MLAMFRHLTIRNYVLIESLEIDLQPGFSVMTGETGAGKSIILGAIGLLMGQRADAGCVMPGAAKCVVEGVFSIEDSDVRAVFEENGLDYEPQECILRREVSANGKSRAFAGDSPVSASVLRRISLRLLDIHSQHANLLLEDPVFQLGIVDAAAGLSELLDQYRSCYADIVSTRRRLREAEADLAKRQDEEDYLRFQLNQLDELNPQPGEDEELRQLQCTLSHAEDVKVALYGVDALLSGGGDEGGAGAVDALQRSCRMMRHVAGFYPAIEDCLNRMESVVIELRDVATDISNRAEGVEYSPSRLQQVTERLDMLLALERKHHVDSSEELVTLAAEMRLQLSSLSGLEDDVEALRKQVEVCTAQARQLAGKLTAGRSKAARRVEELVRESLAEMDMTASVFRVDVESGDELLPEGQDVVTFLFSAGRRMPLKPLADVASGGEMARVMLALKALTGKRMHLPTIIFDEIDTGVSGKVASSMARIMARMSSDAGQQVLAITHLPQIAARGESHYFVYKEDVGARTLTRIRQLNEEQRIAELANMLSGNQVTEAAKENAKHLLSER